MQTTNECLSTNPRAAPARRTEGSGGGYRSLGNAMDKKGVELPCGGECASKQRTVGR